MTDEILDQVRQAAAADEAYAVRHFLVVRQDQELNVMLLDAGESAGEQRYTISVMYEQDGTTMTRDANPAATVQQALHAVHWSEFDAHR